MRDIVTADTFFKSPRTCWEFNREETQTESTGCEPFDDALKNIATEDYQDTIFVYYEIYACRDQRWVPYYTNMRLAGTKGSEEKRWRELIFLAGCSIGKKSRLLVEDDEKIPTPTYFRYWPNCFEPETLAKTKKKKEIFLKSIESCINRRMGFREKHKIPCSKAGKLKDTDDEFMVILQILRAKLILDVDRTWENWI